MPKAALVLIGSELVSFSRPDTNGPCAQEALASIGVPLAFSARVGDRVEEMADGCGDLALGVSGGEHDVVVEGRETAEIPDADVLELQTRQGRCDAFQH